MIEWPLMRTFEQTIEQPCVDDVAGAVRRTLSELGIASRVGRGSKVAVAVGSRGIANLDVVVGEVVAALRAAGAEPFIVPAMGSHGGATADGQADVLRHLGITEDRVGCPIRSDIATHFIGCTEDGFPVHFGRVAMGADAVVPINRVKVHARFVGRFESGLMKMLVVGLGKREGAAAVHRYCLHGGFDELIEGVAGLIFGRIRVPFGVAVIENASHRIARVEAVAGDEILAKEPGLLAEAKELVARLPLADVDLLIVDRIGKEIAGTGMEPYAIGMRSDSPTRVQQIVVLDLSPGSGGNAHGIGFAVFTTQRVWDKIDHDVTRTNAIAAFRPEGARLPIALPTERDAIRAGIDLVGGPQARIVHILDTAHLQRFDASEALWDELESLADVDAVGDAKPMEFDGDGNVLGPFPEGEREGIRHHSGPQ